MKNGNKSGSGRGMAEGSKATQFQPGNPGNPNATGRPRTAKFSEACRQIASEIGKDGLTGAQRLAEYCYKRAMAGSPRHMEMWLHYMEGKPANRSSGDEVPGNDFSVKTDEQVEEFREKILRGETLEIPPATKPN